MELGTNTRPSDSIAVHKSDIRYCPPIRYQILSTNQISVAKILHCTQVIGGDLQDRLIPVPYSKNTTDQAVSLKF